MTGVGSGTATILFTDLVRSTELRARVGDAAADEIYRRHDQLLAEAVERHGGTVVKSLGDGILAAFGGAAEAVVAACDIQAAIDRNNRHADDDRRLEIRVGLSAGDVSWEDGDCHGTPVVAASRLCATASGGEILCDDLVRGLARGRTELSFQLVGETELKGLAEPVVVYSVPWVSNAVEAAPLPAPLRSTEGDLPFAGRDEERRVLAAAWKRAETGAARVVLVSGEPGVGKTRLAAEGARTAHNDGALVLLGRCDEHVVAGFAPWMEALRVLVANLSEDALAQHVQSHGGIAARLVPELSRRVDGVEVPPPAADAEAERLFLFDAVVDLLTASALEAPVFLLLDDAHWADVGTVQLLRHVSTHLPPDARVMIVVTYRDTDVDRGHTLAAALADLHRTPSVERIVLRGLDEEEMRALLTAAGGHELSEDGAALARRLVEETEGNPFFVREVLQHLIESGSMVFRDGEWVGTVAVDEIGLPEGVRDVVGRRLSRISDSGNELLRIAAVIGREFDTDVVVAVSDHDDEVVVDGLDEALRTRLVEDVPDRPGRLTFSHALVRQTLLEELSTNRRVRLHRRIAEALEPRPAVPVEVIAHHYCEAAIAGVPDRAIHYAKAAARAAEGRSAFDDEAEFLRRALEIADLADVHDPRARSELRSLSAAAEHLRGNPEQAWKLALEAAAIARAAGDAAGIAEAGLAYQGGLGTWTSFADQVAIGLMEEGLQGLDEAEHGIRARVAAAMAFALVLQNDGQTLARADEAVRLAREAGDDAALVLAFMARAWCSIGVLPASERIAAATELVEYSKESGYKFEEITGHYLRGQALLGDGDLEGGIAELVESSSTPGQSLEGWAKHGVAASQAFARGQYRQGCELSDRAHELGGELGDTNDGCLYVQRVLAAIQFGELDDFAHWLPKAALNPIAQNGPFAAFLSLARGDREQSIDELVEWENSILDLIPPVLSYFTNLYRAHFIRLLGDSERAAALIPNVERWTGELIANDVWIGDAADAILGWLAALCDRLDDAVELLESGDALHRRLDLSARTAVSSLELGKALCQRAKPGDRDRGEALLRESLDLSERLGLRPLAAEALGALA